MASNQWSNETSVPRKASDDSSVGFVALDGELHVMTLLNGTRLSETRKLRQHKRSATLLLQIYHPRKKRWRSMITNPPFNDPLNFRTAVVCNIGL